MSVGALAAIPALLGTDEDEINSKRLDWKGIAMGYVGIILGIIGLIVIGLYVGGLI